MTTLDFSLPVLAMDHVVTRGFKARSLETGEVATLLMGAPVPYTGGPLGLRGDADICECGHARGHHTVACRQCAGLMRWRRIAQGCPSFRLAGRAS